MNQQSVLNRIAELLARFSEEIKILNDNAEYSINGHAENLLIKILNLVFDWKLENVNYTEHKNYPVIDLIDRNKRIAVQVTSTANFKKIKQTLSTFVSNNLYKEFDKLYIFIITEKKKNYNQDILNRITEGKFKFSTSQIIDRKDVYRLLNEQNDTKLISDVCNLLEEQFSDNNKLGGKWEAYYKGMNEYDQYIVQLYKSIELRGFSPKVNNNIIGLDIDKIYVPLKFRYYFLKTNNKDTQRQDKKESYDIITALECFDKIVILGDPGSGKSTSLKYLAYKICVGRTTKNKISSYIPVFIKATDFVKYYVNTGGTLSEYVIDKYTKYGLLFSNSLENNEMLVLFDGLDEINNTNTRHNIVDRLNSFIAQYPNIKIIVSSRIVGYNETRLNGNFAHFEVDKFSDEQIRLFLNNWFTAISFTSEKNRQNALDEAKELFFSIKKNNSVHKLACNPLLLTIIALIYYQGMKLPQKRVSLYEIATSTFLDNWVKLRAARNIDRETLIGLLAPISFYIHENYSTGLIPETELRSLLSQEYKIIDSYLAPIDIRNSINDIVSYLREDAGFLFEKDRDENNDSLFGFVHLSFQEYFAAIEFKTKWEKGSIKNKLQEYIFNPNWTEVIKLTASLFKLNDPRLGIDKATRFIRDILEINEIIPKMNRPLEIICQILREEVEIKRDLFDIIINKIFDEFLSVKEEMKKGNVTLLMGELYLAWILNTTFYQKYLLGAVRDKIQSAPSSALSKNLIEVLMRTSDIPAVMDFLITILESDQSGLKSYMFNYNTLLPVADIVKTEVFRSEILRYINSQEYSKIYTDSLPPQYVCCFKNKTEEWLSSIRLINDKKMKEDLIDYYVFSWGVGMRDINNLKKYYKAVVSEFPDFELCKIKQHIKKLEKYNSCGLGKYPIATYNDIDIYEKKDSESTYALISGEDMTFVVYPFNIKSLEPIFGAQAKSLSVFLNMILAAYNNESKEVIIHNNAELDTMIEFFDTIHWSSNLKFNNAIYYAISVLFINGVAHEKYLKWLKEFLHDNYRPFKIEPSFDVSKFEEQIKTSSLNVFDKLVLLKAINQEGIDKELISLAIDEYNKTESITKKDEYESILFRVVY